MLTIPFISLYPDLASNLEGLVDARVTPEWTGERDGERQARFLVELEHADGAVMLGQSVDIPWGGRATFEGTQAVDLAIALCPVLAFLPIELCRITPRSMRHAQDRADAARLLRYLARWLAADPDGGADPAAPAATVATPEQRRPEAALHPALALALLPLEPLEQTLNRLAPGFERNRLPAATLPEAVDGFELRDADESDAVVSLLVDSRWDTGCAYFEGDNLGSFAVRLARTFRYLPRDLALSAVRECRRPWDRATAVAALGLQALAPHGAPAEALTATRTALAAAAADADGDVRGLATLYTLLVDARLGRPPAE